MNSKVLNEHLKGVADAIRAKKGTTDLINPQDFSAEIKSIESGGGSGGELEGEYFLAKPNGRYWRSKLAEMARDSYPTINCTKEDLTDEEIESVMLFLYLIATNGFSAIGGYEGAPSSSKDVLCSGTIDVVQKATRQSLNIEQNDWIHAFGAWQEGGYAITANSGSMQINSLVDLMRIIGDGEFDAMSDTEIIAIASEMFQMEQVTKEEYESWYNW